MRQFGYVLATGYILFFYSERLFWSAKRPGDTLPDYLITWLAYSTLAYFFLTIVKVFKTRSIEQVLVAGAMYGWLAEGTLAPTLYGTVPGVPFPLSIVVTAVSWHSLISVLFGWYLAKKVLISGNVLNILIFAIGLGLFWGVWAPFLWSESPPIVVSLLAFLGYATITLSLLVLSYWVAHKFETIKFQPTKPGMIVAILVTGLFYYQDVVALRGVPLIILPTLMAAGCLLLRRRQETIYADLSPKVCIKIGNYMLLLIASVVATGVYSFELKMGHDWVAIHKAVYPITTWGGAISLLICIAILLRAKNKNTAF